MSWCTDFEFRVTQWGSALWFPGGDLHQVRLLGVGGRGELALVDVELALVGVGLA